MSPQQRAIGFVALLIVLSIVARQLDRARVEFPADAALDLAAHAAAVRENLAAAQRRPLAEGETIDPNTADATELARLPRVGDALASRIIAERALAPFSSAPDLERVPGIGPALARSLAPHLTLPREPEPGPASRAAPVGSPPGHAGTGTAPLDINRATPAELEALPGIGPALASRIVAHRDSAGPFRTVEELVRVRGIGPRLLERIAPRVVAR